MHLNISNIVENRLIDEYNIQSKGRCTHINLINLSASFVTRFFFSMTLQPFGPWPLFSFLILYTVGRTPWTGDQPVVRLLPTHRTTQTQNKGTQNKAHRYSCREWDSNLRSQCWSWRRRFMPWTARHCDRRNSFYIRRTPAYSYVSAYASCTQFSDKVE
jgi:hypothetical protein